MPKAKKKTKEEKEKSESITHTQGFAAFVRGGPTDRRIVVKSQRWYQHQINKFKEGEEVTLQVHNRKPKRTEQQNRYYWGVYLPIVSKETGELNIDRLHSLFSGMFLTEGVVVVLGKKTRMKKSTTELSTSEFSQYIMSIEAETGIPAPPTESYGLPPLSENGEVEAKVEYPQESIDPTKMPF